MKDLLIDFYQSISALDFVYIIITVLSLFRCYKMGFVLSVLSLFKWILAYISTLIIFPKIKLYFKDVINNEYIFDIGLWIITFIVIIFVIIIMSKFISKAVYYTGIGNLDFIFGFFFGFIRAYIICVCIFSGVHIVYKYDKWPLNLSKSYIFPYLEKGSNYLLREFPNEKKYKDSKEKIEAL